MEEKVINKFVIIGSRRTRSSHLVRLLNQHPDINCEGEPFWEGYLVERRVKKWSDFTGNDSSQAFNLPELIETRDKDPVGYVKFLFSLFARQAKMNGLKFFPYHSSLVLKYLLESNEILKIILVRNFLFSYISLQQSEMSSNWILKKGESGSSPMVKFQKDGFLDYVKERTTYLQVIFSELKRSGQDYFICFSDEIEGDVWWKDIYSFLGVSRIIKTESDIVKQNPDYLQERVINYQEMVRELMGTKYAPLLYGDFFPDKENFLRDYIFEEGSTETYYYEFNNMLANQNLALQGQIIDQNRSIEKLEKELSTLQNKEEIVDELEEVLTKINDLENDNGILLKKIALIENSLSYRIGYGLTRIPAALLSIFKRGK